MKGRKGAVEVVSFAVPLVVFPAWGLGLPPVLGPAPDMMKVSRGEPKVEWEGEPNGPEEESKCGLSGGLTRILCGGVSLPTRNWGWRPRSLWDKCIGGAMMKAQTQHKGKRDQQGRRGAGSTDYNVETRAERCRINWFQCFIVFLGGVNQALFRLGCVCEVCKF